MKPTKHVLADPLAFARLLMSEFVGLLKIIDTENQRCATLECALLEIRCLLDLPAEGIQREWDQAKLSRIRSIVAGLETSGAIDPTPKS